jgi:hypothetical protein
VKKITPRVCFPNATTRSLEYNYPDAVFELANATAERGLPKQQRLGCLSKASVVCGRYGISEVLQVDCH